MNRHILIILISLYLTTTGFLCNQNEDPLPSTSCQALLVDAQAFEAAITDPFSIQQVSIEGDCLQVQVSYGGGCKPVAFTLITDGKVAYSLPPQAWLFLSLEDKDDCEAAIMEEISFDLSEFKIPREDPGKILLHLAGWEEVIEYSW